jgi:hypothetical protein
MSEKDLELKAGDLEPGLLICRKPYGRGCFISKVDFSKNKCLVKDGNYATWINNSTLLSDWRRQFIKSGG